MTDIAAESEPDANLALSLPDRLAINITVSAIALRKLIDFATVEQRPVADLAAEVELGTTWTRIEEGILQRTRDVYVMFKYIMETRRNESMEGMPQSLIEWKTPPAEDVEKVKEAQEHVVRDTRDVTQLFAAVDAHREAVVWAIYNKYGSMRERQAKYDALSENILAAETTIIRKIDEINEMIGEFMGMIPSREAAFALNDENDAIMEPLVADLERLVDERDALSQRMYDYEVERRQFLHQPPLESEVGGSRGES